MTAVIEVNATQRWHDVSSSHRRKQTHVLSQASAEEDLRSAVSIGYARSHPAYAEKFAVHVCKMVEGVKFFALSALLAPVAEDEE